MHPNDRIARGMRSENLVEKALCLIVGKIITGFTHNEPNSLPDQKGKDFTLTTPHGELGLQVKSSEYGKLHFLRSSQPHREEIPVIVVHDEDTIETLLDRLVAIIREACERIKRKIAFWKGKATIQAKQKEKRRKDRTPRICQYRHSMGY